MLQLASTQPIAVNQLHAGSKVLSRHNMNESHGLDTAFSKNNEVKIIMSRLDELLTF